MVGTVSQLLVVLDVRIPADEWGGVQQVAQGLCHGLGQLDGDEEFIVIAYPDAERWIGPFLSPRVRLEVVPRGAGRSRTRRAYDALASHSPALAVAATRLASPLARSLVQPPRSDGVVEHLRPDVVHFLTPGAMLTTIPSIYQPHDLQHVHLPELFSPVRRKAREVAYRAFAEQAAIVAVMTEWGRDDLVASLGIARSKVGVVPWAPVVGLRPPSTDAAMPELPGRFLVYPAQTWPHKNHMRLLDALASLRRQGLEVPVVFTGRQNEHFPAIAAAVDRHGLRDQVRFLGYVPDAVIDAAFRRATGLVFPSLFEGWGIPVVEAFALGVPVAASNATVLPEITKGAALLFDPLQTEAIADAIRRLWTDEALRVELVAKGRAVAAQLDWVKTAATFVALYRLVTGRPRSPEQAALLEPPTLVA